MHRWATVASQALLALLLTVRELKKLWLVCGVMGDVMPCDRESDIHPSQKI
jgi:hypothetical protein